MTTWTCRQGICVSRWDVLFNRRELRYQKRQLEKECGEWLLTHMREEKIKTGVVTVYGPSGPTLTDPHVRLKVELYHD